MSAPASASSAITGPTSTSSDPAVVALISRTNVCGRPPDVFCTATAVSPRALLTAAHCIADTPLSSMVVLTSDDIDDEVITTVDLTNGSVHPAYAGNDNDVALLAARGELAEWHPVRTDGLDTSAIGATVRLVGYGADDAMKLGVERTGTATISAVDATTFTIVPGPAMSCGGDSGGPVFVMNGATEEVAGVVSYGDGACVQTGVNARTDAAWTAFLEPTISAIDAADAAPARPALDRDVDYCATACETNTDCPAAMECVPTSDGRRCALTGGDVGNVGAACTGEEDCNGVCLSGIDGTDDCYCFTRCDELPDDGCGCSSSDGGASAWLVLVAIAVVVWRRRGAAMLLLLAACGDSGPSDPTPIFAALPLPAEVSGVVSPDPTDVPCSMPGSEPCTVSGASFGVGAAAADIDGDGDVDLYLAGPAGGMLLANDAGVLAVTTGLPAIADYVHGAAFGDLDRDGDAELVLGTNAGVRVLENDGGSFVDRTADLVIAPALTRTLGRVSSVTLGDLDYDGLLDIHVSEYGEPGTATSTAGPGLMLLNRGEWMFEDIAATWPGRHAWASIMADVDRDGWLDLFIASETWDVEENEQATSLYFSNGVDAGGALQLVEDLAIAEAFGRLSTPMGVTAGDPDRDGNLDLVVTLQGPDAYVRRTQGASARTLEVNSYFGPLGVLDGYHTSWSPAIADFDRDGDDEVLITAGAPCLPDDCEVIPASQNARLLEFAGGVLEYANELDVIDAGGLAGAEDEYRNARGLVMADLDGDGRDELLVTPFNDRFRLYTSAVEGGHYLRVELRGTVSAPTPVGAEIELTAGGRTIRRQLTSGGATHSSHAPGLLFELGDASSFEALSITWPSGLIQQIDPGAADRALVIEEPTVLTVGQRAVAPGAPIELWIQRVDLLGAPTGDDGLAGIELQSSDGVPLDLVATGDGRVMATRSAPSTVGATVRVSLVLDGRPCRVRPLFSVR